jgi:hypothetical protein
LRLNAGKSVVAAFAAATLAAACSGSGSEPAAGSGGGGNSTGGTGGAGGSTFAVCPSGIEPTFDSINSKIFSVSCGTDTSGCHSKDGSVDSGGLDLIDDPYTALLGADGKGEPSENLAGSAVMRRVTPGDPDHSLLYKKLTTTTGQSPEFGSGMPFPTPGSVCPDALKAVHDWIQAGAQK